MRFLMATLTFVSLAGMANASQISIGDRLVINNKHTLKIDEKTLTPQIVFSHGWVIDSNKKEVSRCQIQPNRNLFLQQFGDPNGYDYINLNPQEFTVIGLNQSSALLVSKQGGEFILSCMTADAKATFEDKFVSTSFGQLGALIKNGTRDSLKGVISNVFGIKSLTL